MPLSIGSRFGPYEVLAPLGAGGMGEVYRARDNRLGRDVALKVLPQHLAATPELRARFEREAKSISSLNHPHICTLFDVGREGDVDFLIMELVEGETLEARLAKGALPAEQVLKLGAEIADALDKAHKAGIIHRDLKPGNIMLTRNGAKLMDFGLARATGLEGPGTGSGLTMAALTQSPTIAKPLTVEGTLVGTFQYMSPEQLEGRDADSRSDIWAFGCVLFEMATGKRAFEGRSQASLISAIMERVPSSVSQVAPTAPPALDRLVSQCLAKDPEDRWHSAADIRRELEWIATAGSQAGVPVTVSARRKGRERLAWALSAGLALLSLGLAAWMATHPVPSTPATRFSVMPTNGIRTMQWPRISPDGRTLAFLATDTSGKALIWVRPVHTLTATALAGTEGAGRPFWSPDSRYLAFMVGTQLKKIPAAGGPAQLICDARSAADGCWGSKGVILLDGTTSDSIRQVNAEGGEITAATTLNHKRGETSHAWPAFLPDGRHFLFLANSPSRDSTRLCVGCLGSKQVKVLGAGATRMEFAPPGFVVYGAEGTLMARPFDTRSLQFRGEPFPVAERVESSGDLVHFSVSNTGVITFMPSGAGERSRLVWLDRTGREVGHVGGPAAYGDFAISPDGSRVCYGQVDPGTRTSDLWVWDSRREVATKLTFDPKTSEIWPVWAPDGSRIAYASDTRGTYTVWTLPASGTGEPREVCRSSGPTGPSGWPGAGPMLVLNYDDGAPRICTASADTLGPPRPLIGGKAGYTGAQLSPDGRWIAYRSDESGRGEIYVQSFPPSGGKWQVSIQGGGQPFWRGDGKELYYRDRSNGVMAVPVSTSTGFEAGIPVRLFERPAAGGNIIRNRIAPSADGQRFLMNVPEESGALATFTVVQGWTSEIRRK
ncbi:MAG: protein kinase [Candidatus Eisenbacteria bacterium]|nr:protein kinase [Candidatus Eisenbacteria bacterium]